MIMSSRRLAQRFKRATRILDIEEEGAEVTKLILPHFGCNPPPISAVLLVEWWAREMVVLLEPNQCVGLGYSIGN